MRIEEISAAAAVMRGAYISVSNVTGGENGLSVSMGLSSDELVPMIVKPVLSALYTNNLTASISANFWAVLYSNIFRVNSIIEGVNASQGSINCGKGTVDRAVEIFTCLLLFLPGEPVWRSPIGCKH